MCRENSWGEGGAPYQDVTLSFLHQYCHSLLVLLDHVLSSLLVLELSSAALDLACTWPRMPHWHRGRAFTSSSTQTPSQGQQNSMMRTQAQSATLQHSGVCTGTKAFLRRGLRLTARLGPKHTQT